MYKLNAPQNINIKDFMIDRFKSNVRMIFLAGPIQGAEDWQSEVLSHMKDQECLIANPRRDKLANDFDYNEQVEWETRYLNLADIILFWIPIKTEEVEGRDYAQTTRFELAEWLAKSKNPQYNGKQILVGIQDGFSGKRYIKKRILDDYKHVKFYDDFASLMLGLSETFRYIQEEKIFMTPNISDFTNGEDYAEAMIRYSTNLFIVDENSIDSIIDNVIFTK